MASAARTQTDQLRQIQEDLLKLNYQCESIYLAVQRGKTLSQEEEKIVNSAYETIGKGLPSWIKKEDRAWWRFSQIKSLVYKILKKDEIKKSVEKFNQILAGRRVPEPIEKAPAKSSLEWPVF